MSISLIQQATPTVTGAASGNISSPGSVTAGNLVIVYIESTGPGTTVGSVTGLGPVTYTRQSSRSFAAGCGGVEAWAGIAASSGAETVTVSAAGSGAIILFLREYRATLGWQALPAVGANVGSGTSAAAATTSFASGQTNNLVTGICGSASVSASAGTGYGNLQSTTNGSTNVAVEDQLNVAAGSYTLPFTLSGSNNWCDSGAVFAEVAAAAGNLFRPPGLNGISTGGPFFSNPLG